MVSGDHHQVKYNDGRLDSLISDNIRLLRSIIGSELDDIYEEEFGSPFKVDATLTERASDDDGIVQEDASNARRLVLEDQFESLESNLKDRNTQHVRLKHEYEATKKDAAFYKHQYESLTSQLLRSNETRVEHYNLLQHFQKLSLQLKQARDTNEKLEAKLQLREHALSDSQVIKDAMERMESAREGESRNEGAGVAPSPLAAASPSPSGKDREDMKHTHRFFFLADSAATALEMERLRSMLRKAGERLHDAERERKAASKLASQLNIQVDQADEARKEVLVEIAKTRVALTTKTPGNETDSEALDTRYLTVPDLSRLAEDSLRSEDAGVEQGEARSPPESTPGAKSEDPTMMSPAMQNPIEFSGAVMDSAPSSAFPTLERPAATQPASSSPSLSDMGDDREPSEAGAGGRSRSCASCLRGGGSTA